MKKDPTIEPYDRVHPWASGDDPGITLRQYFAAIALQGLLANDKWEFELAAENAVDLADELIKALNK